MMKRIIIITGQKMLKSTVVIAVVAIIKQGLKKNRPLCTPILISSEDYSSNYHDDNSNFQIQGTSNINNLDIPKSQYQIIVEPSLCLAFGSCETLAPKVFAVEKNKRINPKAIVKSETGANIETILDAAKTCPTKAIIIIDRYSGERIYP